MKLWPIYFAAWLLFSVVGQLRADLPSEAQALEAKGIIAAKVPDYLLAIRYFQDARKIAPNSPEIFFNLGLAESKIPGRELRAICWFGAYLDSSPNASNASAVRASITRLQIKNEGNLVRIIDIIQDAAGKLWPAPTGSSLSSVDNYNRETPVERIAELRAKSGDFEKALKMSASLVLTKDSALAKIAYVQAEAGDYSGALSTAGTISDPASKKRATDAIPDIEALFRGTNHSYYLDWLSKLTDENRSNGCPLNIDLFLNVTAYMDSQHSNDPAQVYGNLITAAEKMAEARSIVYRMLKFQTEKI